MLEARVVSARGCIDGDGVYERSGLATIHQTRNGDELATKVWSPGPRSRNEDWV